MDDLIPDSHTNLLSLANPLGCYGVALGIKVGRAQAWKRVIVRCGRRFG